MNGSELGVPLLSKLAGGPRSKARFCWGYWTGFSIFEMRLPIREGIS